MLLVALTSQVVGWLLVAGAAGRLSSTDNGRDAGWVYEMLVDAGERNKGYGRAIMRAAEEEVIRRGVTRMALNVFTGNTAAFQLYESLGYRVAAQQMVKRIR